MDGFDETGFNIFGADEFLNLACEDIQSSIVEVVSSGIGCQVLDSNAVEITKTLDEAVRNAFAASDQFVAEAAALTREIDIFDQHGFTEADYQLICNGGEFTFPLAEAIENIPSVSNAPSQSYAKITDFPLDPGGMTFEFCHEWVMLCAGRKRTLENELKERLQREYNAMLYDRHNEEGVKQGDIDFIAEALSNEKLETYAKLGMHSELETLTSEIADKLDFCQRDRCGVTLLGRLCIWPCGWKTHAYCKLIQFMASKCQDKWEVVNMKSMASRTSALMIAARVGELCKVDALLKCGAHINDVDSEGRTALMLAAERGRLDIVDRLLSCGANPSPLSINSQTAACLAAEKGYIDVHRRITNYTTNLSNALKRLGEKIAGNMISIGTAVTPLFAMSLREVQSFNAEFVPQLEGFAGQPMKGQAALLLIAFVHRDVRGKFRSRRTTNLQSVCLNDVQQESLMENCDAINIFTMLTLKQCQPNWIELTFKDCPRNSKVKILAQGFACDFSKALALRRQCAQIPSPIPAVAYGGSIMANSDAVNPLEENTAWENVPPVKMMTGTFAY